MKPSLELLECLLERPRGGSTGGGDDAGVVGGRGPPVGSGRINLCYQRHCTKNREAGESGDNTAICDATVIKQMIREALSGTRLRDAVRMFGGRPRGTEATIDADNSADLRTDENDVQRMRNRIIKGFKQQNLDLLENDGGMKSYSQKAEERPKRWQYSDPLQACITTNCQGLRKVPFYQCAYAKCIAEEEKEDK